MLFPKTCRHYQSDFCNLVKVHPPATQDNAMMKFVDNAVF